MIDTYRQAVLINYGYAQDLGMLDLPPHPKSNQGGLAAGILLTTVGVFAFLEYHRHGNANVPMALCLAIGFAIASQSGVVLLWTGC